MANGPPKLVAINHDDYHAKHVGRTQDGRQFFLTTPFVPALKPSVGNEFIALYLFDAAGALLEAEIDELGSRASVDLDKADQLLKRRLVELGAVTFERIEVQPFSITRFGTEFGFILRPPDNDGDGWWVEVQPGNVIAFHEPWDSGEYDT